MKGPAQWVVLTDGGDWPQLRSIGDAVFLANISTDPSELILELATGAEINDPEFSVSVLCDESGHPLLIPGGWAA